MEASPSEKFCAGLEARVEDNRVLLTLITMVRIQRAALEDIKQRCDDDYKKANGSCLLFAKGALEAVDMLALYEDL